jgi:hypothetical protein
VLNYSKLARDEMALEIVDVEKLIAEIIESYPNLSQSASTILVQTSIAPLLANRAALTRASWIECDYGSRTMASVSPPKARNESFAYSNA